MASMMRSVQEKPSETDPVGADAVRDALARILASANFLASERNKRFLGFVVEETLAGRSERIKAYTIAVDVFNRDEGFDAVADPLIRIEASRLRRGLEHYYLTDGRDDPVRILIPKGGYVPQFRAVPPPEADAAEAGPADAVPADAAPGGTGGGRGAWRRPAAAIGLAAGLVLVLVPAGLWLWSAD